MTSVPIWYQFMAFSATALALLLAYHTWKMRSTPGLVTATVLMLAVAWWSLSSVFELASPTLAGKVFWVKVEYPGIVTVPVTWYLLVREYFGHTSRLPRRFVYLCYLIPLLTMLFHWTNEMHGLMYTDVQLIKCGPIDVLSFERGPWFSIFIAYVYIVSILSVAYCLQSWSHLHPYYRRQMIAVLSAACVPLIVNLMYLKHWGPLPYLDLTPLAFTCTGIAVVWGVKKYRLMDIAPIARNIVFEQLQDCVLVVDLNGRIVDCNKSALLLLGVEIAHVIGQPLASLAPHWQELAQLPLGDVEKHTTLTTPTAPPRTFECRVSPLGSATVQPAGWALILHDITERQQFEEQLHQMAYFDTLTGLPNRALFRDRFERALVRGRRNRTSTGLIFLDLDQFKEVNDSCGHSVGDAVLQAVAHRLTTCVRESDTVSRLGGDEFVIVLPEIHDREDMIQTARRILASLEAPIIVGARRFIVTPSLGLTIAPHDGYTVDELLRNADRAMYQAKMQGKNTFVLHDPLRQQTIAP